MQDRWPEVFVQCNKLLYKKGRKRYAYNHNFIESKWSVLTGIDLGIPSLDLRPIDPMFVEKMDIVQGNPTGPVSLRIDMQNVTTVGYSDLRLSKVV